VIAHGSLHPENTRKLRSIGAGRPDLKSDLSEVASLVAKALERPGKLSTKRVVVAQMQIGRVQFAAPHARENRGAWTFVVVVGPRLVTSSTSGN